MMHFARLDRSDTLRRILLLLQTRGEAGVTTAEISQAFREAGSGLESVSTWISALRHNGVNVECEYVGMTETRRKIYKYRLVSA